MEELFGQILGPVGVAVGAVLLVIVLGRIHLKDDDKCDAMVLKLEALLDVATEGWKAQTAANAVLAAALKRKATTGTRQ